GLLIYLDVPKNEIQFRSRAGSVHNLGAEAAADPKAMYKRFYFVDWPVLNAHRVDILNRIDIIVDTQRPDEPAAMKGDDFRAGLDAMSENFIRVRPWFEPGPWGGQWIKSHIPQLSRDVPNYAWSFELISPENGIAFESDGKLCEVSFDFLMMHNHRQVLGDFANRFGYSFPIRYDFLDTFGGGNLSLQCHPRPEYAYKHFGEYFTQDETYYILDCMPDAKVYLGFKENTDISEFRGELEKSVATGEEVDVERHVNTEQANKHDLFLIPHGTIHCSGKNNLVLEISATPYIFTFKMYDWMRMDLEGNPRTLNIQRAFENLYFERKGARVRAELVSHPALLSEGSDWQLFHLPTHPDHFYDVHRFEFKTSVEAKTEGSCHVMNLVEGKSITLETANGMRQEFNYAETFIIPAAARSYRLVNNGESVAKVVKTFLKPAARPFARPDGAQE
ncbi:MAG: class I mannose-6-phosphate isomerase, partial [bacterium]